MNREGWLIQAQTAEARASAVAARPGIAEPQLGAPWLARGQSATDRATTDPAPRIPFSFQLSALSPSASFHPSSLCPVSCVLCSESRTTTRTRTSTISAPRTLNTEHRTPNTGHRSPITDHRSPITVPVPRSAFSFQPSAFIPHPSSLCPVSCVLCPASSTRTSTISVSHILNTEHRSPPRLPFSIQLSSLIPEISVHLLSPGKELR